MYAEFGLCFSIKEKRQQQRKPEIKIYIKFNVLFLKPFIDFEGKEISIRSAVNGFYLNKWLECRIRCRFDMKRVNREMDWKVNKQLIKVKGVTYQFNTFQHNAIIIVTIRSMVETTKSWERQR